MKIKVRFNNARRSPVSARAARKAVSPTIVFRRSPLVCAVSAAALMFSVSAAATPPTAYVIDQDNADVVVSGNASGSVATEGSGWHDATVTVASGATLASHDDAISAIDVRDSLSIAVAGSIVAAPGESLARAIVDRSQVDAESANVGAHVITIENGAGLALSGDSLRALVSMSVYGDGGEGSQTVTLNGANVSLDAGTYDGEVHGIDLLLIGDSAVSQNVSINGGSLAVTAGQGAATGISRQATHGSVGGDYLGDFGATVTGGIVTSAAGMSTDIGVIAADDATVSLGAGATLQANSSGDYAFGVYLGDIDGIATVDLDRASIDASGAARAIGVNVIDAANAGMRLDNAVLDIESASGGEASGIRLDNVAGNSDVLVTGGSTIDAAALGAATGVIVIDGNDTVGDSANVTVGGGAAVSATAGYVAIGVGASRVDTVTIAVDAASIAAHDNNPEAEGFLPASGIVLEGARESGTINMRNGAQVLAEGKDATGVYAMSGGFLQMSLDGSAVTASGTRTATGLEVDSAQGGILSLSGATVSASAAAGDATVIKADSLGYIDMEMNGSTLQGTGLARARGIDVTNAASATLMIDGSTFSISSAADDGAGMAFGNVRTIDLALSDTAVNVTGQGLPAGVIADGFDTLSIGMAGGSSVTVDSAVDSDGLRLANGGVATVMLTDGSSIKATGPSATFYGVDANNVGRVDLTLDHSVIDAGNASLGSIAVYERSGSELNLSLVNGSFLVSNSAATSYSAGIAAMDDATVTIDSTSGIIDSAVAGNTDGYKAAILAVRNLSLTNAGLISSRDTAIESLGIGTVTAINTGVIVGDNYAAIGKVVMDNAGLLAGRLDIADLTSRTGSELRALLDVDSPLLGAGDAYWKVSGAATIENGASIRVNVSTALGRAIQADVSGHQYLMLEAGELNADLSAIALSTGPLLQAAFISGMPAGSLGVTLQRVPCADAGLTTNGAAACEAASADGNVDLNGNPDTWVPIVSGMVREAPRMAADMISTSVRRRLIAAIDGENSGDTSAAPKSVWFDARTSSSSQDADASSPGFNADGGSFTLGTDATIGDSLRVGIAASKASIAADEDGNDNAIDRDGTLFSLYGAWESGSLGVETQLTMGNWSNDQVRHAGAERIVAAYDSAQAGFSALAHYTLGSAGLQIQPEIAASYQKLDIHGYAEQGNGTPSSNALFVDSQSYEEGEAGLGVQLSREHVTPRGNVLKPSLDLMVWHDFIQDQTRTLSYFLSGSPAFVSEGAPSDANRVAAALALEYRTNDGLKLKLSGDLSARDGYLGKALSMWVEYSY